jgi:hypothetical protein
MCEMLKSNTKHLWSNDNGTTWVQPPYHSISGNNGGSGSNYPRDNVAGDERRYPGFWGTNDGRTGGCCATSTADYVLDSPYWGLPFTMSFARDPTWTTLAVVPGTTAADDAFWATKCATLPADAGMLKLEIGTAVDFYRWVPPLLCVECGVDLGIWPGPADGVWPLTRPLPRTRTPDRVAPGRCRGALCARC